MRSKHHAFYVYYQENRVMARRGTEEPVVAETCEPVKNTEGKEVVSAAQVAHDKVQAIVNPRGLKMEDFRVVENGVVVSDLGFGDPRFQQEISGNCEAYVNAAYEKATADKIEKSD